MHDRLSERAHGLRVVIVDENRELMREICVQNESFFKKRNNT